VVAPLARLRSLSNRRGAVAAALAVLVAVVCVVAWSKCGGRPGEEPAQATTPAEPPLPAPAGLLADVTMGSPNASWGKLQRGVGGAVGILPASAGGIICAAAGLDPFVAAEVDGAAPAFGSIAGDPTDAGFVVALKLLDVRKARGVLVDGDTARYTARETGAVTELLPKGEASPAPVSVGLSPNGYLLLARRSEDLARLAPYVTRTLPQRPLPTAGAIVLDVPRSALASVIKPKLDELWATAKTFLLAADDRMRRDHGGRAPDFGDPKAIVGAVDGWVTRHIAIVSDLERMRLAFDVVDDGVSLVTTMTPAAPSGPASTWTEAMTIGDVAPLRTLPASAAAALMTRDGEEARAEQARALEKVLAASLGSRLAEPDAKKLHDVLDDATKARGEVLTTSLAWDEPQGLSLRGPVRDEGATTRALRAASELVKVAPFKEILRVRGVTLSSEDVPTVGQASLVTVAREPSREGARKTPSRRPSMPSSSGTASAPSGATWGTDAGAAPPPPRPKKDELGLAWIIEGGVLSLATGDTPLATLQAAVRPDRTLADEPTIARALAALGVTSSTVLVVQPLRFDPTRAHLPAAPLVIALGRKDKDATLRIEVANGVLREILRRQMGL
jgi:hypothetical protein